MKVPNQTTLRIGAGAGAGAGAGHSGDRIAPAVELAEKGELHYLAFEYLTPCFAWRRCTHMKSA